MPCCVAVGELNPVELKSLDDECRRLLKIVQDRCPGLLATAPIPPGQTARPIEITDDELADILRAAMRISAGLDPNDPVIVWTGGQAELAVLIDRTRALVGDGVIVVELTVQSDQTGSVHVAVPFSVGSAQRPAGMVAATESVPRGPESIVAAWGEALVAAAWDAVMRATIRLAALAGRDEDGEALVPGAMVASRGILSVIPQARHEVDRAVGGTLGRGTTDDAG